MNLALVTETYAPEINGVAMSLSQLVGGLRARNHRVQVARPLQRGERGEPKGTVDTLTVPGVPIPNYREMRLGLPSKRRLLQAWKNDSPDLVHVATEGPLGLSAIRAAKTLGLPCTSSFHTNFHSYAQHYHAAFIGRYALAYLRWVHNQTRCTLAPTAVLAEELAQEGFERTGVLGRGVPLDVFNPSRRDEDLRRDWSAGPETRVFIHVSRVAAEKSYDLLFATYELLHERYPDSQFIVVGSGPQLPRYRKRYPQFRFTGPIELDDRENLARHYASADYFLYASSTETYGNVVPEAMACGNAVLAYDYAAARQHIRDGENGRVVPLHDWEAFKDAALSLADDPATARELGRQAAAGAARFDWQPVFDSFETTLLRHAEQTVVEARLARTR